VETAEEVREEDNPSHGSIGVANRVNGRAGANGATARRGRRAARAADAVTAVLAPPVIALADDGLAPAGKTGAAKKRATPSLKHGRGADVNVNVGAEAKANGHAKGKANGHDEGKANGHANGGTEAKTNGGAAAKVNGTSNGTSNGQAATKARVIGGAAAKAKVIVGGNGNVKGNANGTSNGHANGGTEAKANGGAAAKAKVIVGGNGRTNGRANGRANGRTNGKANGTSGSAADLRPDGSTPALTWDGPPVAVLVVDGDTESRNRLSAIINKGEHVILTASVGTLADAVEAARRTRPEVVLSELFLPDGDPAALRSRFAPLGPRPQLVVITRFSVRGARVASTVAGARTCLASSAQPDSVLAAVLAAAKGESWDGAGAVGSRLDRVSPLEAKVLAGVASGATNDEIARALGYSVHYVKDLLEGVRHRLGAKDRAHASSLAVSLRLIRPARDGRFISAVPN
jgi:DNA-binding NarL/FixJ family response regulator